MFNSANQKNRKNKLPYIQIIGATLLLVFLAITLGSQITSYAKDISEKSYIQYEGPASVRTEHQVVFGGIPTGYNEYIISFNHKWKQIELYIRKDPGISGNIDEIYIVYSNHSNFVFEIVDRRELCE